MTNISDEQLYGFGPGNPQLLRDIWQSGDPAWQDKIRAFLEGKSSIFAHGAVAVDVGGNMLTAEPVRHVIPVYDKHTDCGFMVPLRMEPARAWHVSDAFGRFVEGESDPAAAFDSCVDIVQRAWEQSHPNPCLPLRWRHPLRISLGCAVHLERIDGESLQVPLVIAVLRAVCELAGHAMPFGPGPVFSTGELAEDGTFLPVGFVAKKLEAFIREYGPGHTALLSPRQLRELKLDSPFLQDVDPVAVHSLQALFDRPEMQDSLLPLCNAPDPREMDGLLPRIAEAKQRIDFTEMERMAKWALERKWSLPNEAMLRHHLALGGAYRAAAFEARHHFERLRALLGRPNARDLGADDWIHHYTALQRFGFYMANPDWCKRLDATAEALLPHASLLRRLAYHGSHCQLGRVHDRHDEAVAHGETSRKIAKRGHHGEVARATNYLAHVLLHRARRNGPSADADRQRARKLIAESRGKWAPAHPGARAVNEYHCLLYEAELDRQAGRVSPVEPPTYRGGWEVGYDLYATALARQAGRAQAERLQLLDDILERRGAWGAARVGELYLACWRLYRAEVRGNGTMPACAALEGVLDRFEAYGHPGWKRRLSGAIAKVRAGEPGAVEALMDRVPFW